MKEQKNLIIKCPNCKYKIDVEKEVVEYIKHKQNTNLNDEEV